MREFEIFVDITKNLKTDNSQMNSFYLKYIEYMLNTPKTHGKISKI